MDAISSSTPREKLIEYVRRMPEAKLALAEQVIGALEGHAGDTLLDYAHPHIVSRQGILNGEPVVRSTRTSVRAIVEHWRMGLAPAEIVEALPHLTLAQIFDALGYYSDHQAEINAHIEHNRISDSLLHPFVKATL